MSRVGRRGRRAATFLIARAIPGASCFQYLAVVCVVDLQVLAQQVGGQGFNLLWVDERPQRVAQREQECLQARIRSRNIVLAVERAADFAQCDERAGWPTRFVEDGLGGQAEPARTAVRERQAEFTADAASLSCLVQQGLDLCIAAGQSAK